jgi:hypothetical protein
MQVSLKASKVKGQNIIALKTKLKEAVGKTCRLWSASTTNTFVNHWLHIKFGKQAFSYADPTTNNELSINFEETGVSHGYVTHLSPQNLVNTFFNTFKHVHEAPV